MPEIIWRYAPGDEVKRTLLHEQYGGSGQGGISPSTTSDMIFIFSDPDTGLQHGYIDRWDGDGCFHYTGMGQRGDQVMKFGNASILNHKKDGRALRLFFGSRGIVKYVDEFEVDEQRPFYTADAPETGGGSVRKVIVFRLRPKTVASPVVSITAGAPNILKLVSIEEAHTEKAVVEPSRKPYEAERREAKLVLKFADYYAAHGHVAQRYQILPPGEARPLFTDLYFPSLRLLVEAKGTVERGAIRMALAQLLDYSRFIDSAAGAVLLPERPRQDLVDYVLRYGMQLIFQDGKEFVHEVRQEGRDIQQRIWV